jgi:hypothetical protein
MMNWGYPQQFTNHYWIKYYFYLILYYVETCFIYVGMREMCNSFGAQHGVDMCHLKIIFKHQVAYI